MLVGYEEQKPKQFLVIRQPVIRPTIVGLLLV